MRRHLFRRRCWSASRGYSASATAILRASTRPANGRGRRWSRRARRWRDGCRPSRAKWSSRAAEPRATTWRFSALCDVTEERRASTSSRRRSSIQRFSGPARNSRAKARGWPAWRGQAGGRLAVDGWALGVDLYSLSGHKLNAPKGVGVLAVRYGVSLEAVQHGGRHERERRAGTENVPGIAALGSAAVWLVEHRAEEARRLGFLRDRLETAIVQNVPGTRVNAASAPRTPNTTNVRFEGVAGEALAIALDLAGFQVSTGA